jgi:hypothetical protein
MYSIWVTYLFVSAVELCPENHCTGRKLSHNIRVVKCKRHSLVMLEYCYWWKGSLFFLAQTFISSFRSIEDILSLNNYLHRISPNDLEVKDITDTQKSTSCLDLHLDNGGILKTKHYVKRDDYTFPIVNFPFISSKASRGALFVVIVIPIVCWNTLSVFYWNNGVMSVK